MHESNCPYWTLFVCRCGKKPFALAALLLAALLSGCANLPMATQDSASKEYKMDLGLVVNGIAGKGTMVVPKSALYDIQVTAPDNADIVTINTCHREMILNKQDNKFGVKFTPTDIENNGYCPIIISAFAPTFTYAGGFIDVQDVDLPAILTCNGKTANTSGVSVCQSRMGMIEKIQFADPVNAGVPDLPCPALSGSPGVSFEVHLGKGRCVYAFKEVSSGRIHRLTTQGYEQFMLGR